MTSTSSSPVRIVAARYVLPVIGEPIEHGAVAVEGDTIVAVGTLVDLAAQYAGAEVSDYGLAAMTPGFIDNHTHLEYTAMRGLIEDAPYSRWKYEVMRRELLLTPEDWEDSALLGAIEAALSGITTVADITKSGSSGRAAQRIGLRSVIYREVGTMDRNAVDATMAAASSDIERWRAEWDSSRTTVGIAPHSAYSCHPHLFRKVAEYAADGTPVAMHLAGSQEEYQFVKYGSSMLGHEVREQYNAEAPLWLPTGVSPVRYVQQWEIFHAPNVMAVHCTQVDDDDIEILATYDIAVAHCPRCNSKLAMGIMPLKKMLDAGIRVGLGTDSPAASNSMDTFEEMRIGLLVQRAALGRDHFFTAAQFLKMATYESARALRMEDTIGSLEVGKRADLIVVDLSGSAQAPTQDPASAIVHTAHQNNVSMTMVGGEVIYERGTFSHVDLAPLTARAQELRDKLRA